MASFIDRACETEKITLKCNYWHTDFESAASAVATTDLGITMTLASIARRFERHYPVKAIALRDTWAHAEFVTCIKDVATFPPAWAEFVGMLRKRHTPIR